MQMKRFSLLAIAFVLGFGFLNACGAPEAPVEEPATEEVAPEETTEESEEEVTEESEESEEAPAEESEE